MRSRKSIPLASAALAVGCALPLAVVADVPANQEEVVVTATLTARDSATSPAFTSVISAEDIARAPINSLADLLRESVGVNNQTDPTGRDNIQIRGLGGKYTLVLVDGKRVSSSGALWRGGDFDYSSIPLASIERVEIVRGPMAALYGSDAIGGVVNIITRYPTEDWHGSVGAELRRIAKGDEGDQRRISAAASGALNEVVALSVSGEIYERDAWFRYDANDPKEVPALEEKEAHNLLATVKVKLNEQQLLDIDLGYNMDKRPYMLYSYNYYPDFDFESFGYRDQDIERYTYGLTHTGTWGWGKTVVFVKREDSEIDDYNSSYNDPQWRTLNEENLYAKAYAAGEWGRHAWIAGVDYQDQQIKDAATYLQTGEVTTKSQALFVQDEIALTEKINLTLGGRLDDHDVFGEEFSPKSYLTYQLSDAVVIKGGVSKAFKAPDAYQLSPQYSVISCGGSCYLAGNPDLTPETSLNYEVGVEVNQERWDVSAVVFRNEVEDMIVAVYDPAGPSREWVNVEEAETRGIELEGNYRFSPVLDLSGNATYLDTERKQASGEELELDNTPELMANLTLNARLSDVFRLSVSANRVGKQVYDGNDLPAYNRFDLTAAWDIAEALVLRFGVKNLTDVDLQKENQNFINRELGRNYYVSATYQF